MSRFCAPSANAPGLRHESNWASAIALALPLLFCRIAVGQTAPSVQDLVAAHDSSLQEIHAADIAAVMQQAERFDASDADLRFRDSRQYRLRFSGVQQRLTEHALETPRPARNYHIDSYTDGLVRWTLRDFDRDHPPRITPLEPAGAEGNISLEILGQMPSPTEWMLLLFRVGTGKREMSPH